MVEPVVALLSTPKIYWLVAFFSRKKAPPAPVTLVPIEVVAIQGPHRAISLPYGSAFQ